MIEVFRSVQLDLMLILSVILDTVLVSNLHISLKLGVNGIGFTDTEAIPASWEATS